MLDFLLQARRAAVNEKVINGSAEEPKASDKIADVSKVTSKIKIIDKSPDATALKNMGKNLAQNLDDIATKATNKVDDLATKASNKLDNITMKASSKLGNLTMKASSKLGNLTMKASSKLDNLTTKASNKLDDLVMASSKRLGDSIDQMRYAMDQLTQYSY